MVDASCRDVGSVMGGLVEIAVGCSVNGPPEVGGNVVPSDAATGLFKVTLLPSFCVGNLSFEEPPWLSDEIALLSAMHLGLAAAKSPPRNRPQTQSSLLRQNGRTPIRKVLATDNPYGIRHRKPGQLCT